LYLSYRKSKTAMLPLVISVVAESQFQHEVVLKPRPHTIKEEICSQQSLSGPGLLLIWTAFYFLCLSVSFDNS
jgi:hypothetical protein